MDRKSLKTRYILSIIANLTIVILTAYSVIQFFVASGDGNMSVQGVTCFRYFTIDSNILCAIFALLLIPYAIRGLRTGESSFPIRLEIGKFVGTTAVGVTFFTVLFFLGPTMGYDVVFSGTSLFLHLICPLTAIISFLCFETEHFLGRAPILLSLVPTVIYGMIYFVMAIGVGEAQGGWPDFYGFNRGGLWPVSIVVMLIAESLLAVALAFVHNKVMLMQRKTIENSENAK